MKRKMIALTLLLCMLIGCLAGCGTASENEGTTKTVVDMLGNSVEIPANPKKIMIHWASGVTLALTLGSADRLSVIPEAFDSETFNWVRVICPGVKDVKMDTKAFQSTETALTYGPEVIIANDKDILAQYQELGIPAVYVELTSYENYKKALLVLGEVLGRDEYKLAEEYGKYFDASVEMVTERLKDLPEEERPSVYYLDTRFGDAYHTVGTGELQEDWIRFAGGKLATEGHFTGRNIEITVEEFLSIDPDIIIVGGHMESEVYDLLMNDPLLKGLTAVQNAKVYRNPYGLYAWEREGSEAALQIPWAAKLLHPESFEDVDMMKMAGDFYQKFYGVELSDQELGAILDGKLSVDAK